MSEMTIRTNRHWRSFLVPWDLTDRELSEFDYQLSDEYRDAVSAGEMGIREAFDTDESAPVDGYIRYKGWVYHLDQFMRVGYPAWSGQTDRYGFHAHHADSAFSGVAIRVSDDGEQYQIATYIS